MTSTASEIIVQSQAGVTHDVEALVQAAVSVLTNDIQIATTDQTVVETTQHDQNTVQLLVDTCATNNIQDRLYMCTDCNLAFYGEQGEQDWQWHLKQHRPFKCDLCSEAFEQKETLKTHMRSHTMQMPFICDRCGSAYTLKSNLTQHMKSHEDQLYQCTECNVVFKTQVNLEKHMKFHTGETIKVYQCEHCSKTFTQQKNLVQHLKIHMGGDKAYKCSECPASYSYKCHLSRHLMIHTGDKPYKCKFCSKSFNRNAHLVRHRKIHSGGEKEWKCQQCGFAFWEKSDLIRHIKSHEGNRPFRCDFCEQTFVWKRYLLKHLNNHHKAEDRHFCQECASCFDTVEGLAEHDAQAHANKKQLTHTCDICNQEFYFKYKLDEHMFIHTGRKAHACTKCPQKFVSRKELDRHIAEHAQEVSFRCNTCEKSFSSINQLQQHVKLHTGEGRYPCSICGSSFRWKSQLTSHMVVHSTDYDFNCSVCNKQFKRKRDLTRHIKIYHDTKPPYTCTECNEDFHSPYNLYKHKSDTHWKRLDHVEEFPCTHCTGVFRIKQDLDKHMTKVHPPRPYICITCSKKFTMMKFLEKHFELKHEGVEMVEGENYEIRELKDQNAVNVKMEIEEFTNTEEEKQVTEFIGANEGEVIVFENVEELQNGEELQELEKVSIEHVAIQEGEGQTIVENAESVAQELHSDVAMQVDTSYTEMDTQEQPLSEAITLAHLSQQTGPVYLDQMIEQKTETLEKQVVYKLPNTVGVSHVTEQIVDSSSLPIFSATSLQPAAPTVMEVHQANDKFQEPPKLLRLHVPPGKTVAQVVSQQLQAQAQQIGSKAPPKVIKINTKQLPFGTVGQSPAGASPKVQQIKVQRIIKSIGPPGVHNNIKIIPSPVQSSPQVVSVSKVVEPVVSTGTVSQAETPVMAYGDNIAMDAQLIAGLVNVATDGTEIHQAQDIVVNPEQPVFSTTTTATPVHFVHNVSGQM